MNKVCMTTIGQYIYPNSTDIVYFRATLLTNIYHCFARYGNLKVDLYGLTGVNKIMKNG